MMMTAKKVWIQTIGCQMNVYDSERMEASLQKLGYQAALSEETADLIIVNTCAIRAKAEQKLYSLLGRLAPLKARNADLILAVGGCVAQQEGAAMLTRVPFVDLVFGTDAQGRLPALVEKIDAKRVRIVDVGPRNDHDIPTGFTLTGNGVSRFVTIMRGCDNFCTYCVVPYVRGREVSRSPDRIIDEIKKLVASGAREVTLLGQNVNSYGNKEGMATFTELLESVNAIDGLARIRFTTSHPKDLSDNLIAAFGRLDKLCHHIHLPVQSGSDPMLKRMNRKYTRTHYLDLVERLRVVCPDIAITTDIIVGFPGETEEDFKKTLDLIDTVRFDSLFAFMYSDRPNATAAGYDGKIGEKEKSRRLQQVLSRQQQITREQHQALVGTIQEVLVEGIGRGISTKDRQWSGRTSTFKIVNFPCVEIKPAKETDLAGRLINTQITKGFSHSLLGKPVVSSGINPRRKGVQDRAA